MQTPHILGFLASPRGTSTVELFARKRCIKSLTVSKINETKVRAQLTLRPVQNLWRRGRDTPKTEVVSCVFIRTPGGSRGAPERAPLTGRYSQGLTSHLRPINLHKCTRRLRLLVDVQEVTQNFKIFCFIVFRSDPLCLKKIIMYISTSRN